MSISKFLKIFDFIEKRIPKKPKVIGLNITNSMKKSLNSMYEWESSEEYCFNKISHNLLIQKITLLLIEWN